MSLKKNAPIIKGKIFTRIIMRILNWSKLHIDEKKPFHFVENICFDSINLGKKSVPNLGKNLFQLGDPIFYLGKIYTW